jgi:hypothetical protein
MRPRIPTKGGFNMSETTREEVMVRQLLASIKKQRANGCTIDQFPLEDRTVFLVILPLKLPLPAAKAFQEGIGVAMTELMEWLGFKIGHAEESVVELPPDDLWPSRN